MICTAVIEMMPASVVGFDMPFCEKHNQCHVVYKTRKNVRGYVMEVTRYHHCKKCDAEGVQNPKPLFHAKNFKVCTMYD